MRPLLFPEAAALGDFFAFIAMLFAMTVADVRD
jgi:hypothetical protein